MKTCSKCQGRGKVYIAVGDEVNLEVCHICNGQGVVGEIEQENQPKKEREY